MEMQNNVFDRIERELGYIGLATALSEKLSSSDLTALLLEVFECKSKINTPASILKNYETNRFASPSTLDPIRYCELEADILRESKEHGFTPLLLSPAALQGAASAFGTVSQNKIISAIRGVELISDATNMMCLYIADAIKHGRLDNAAQPINICSTQRLVRVQSKYKPGQLAHFGLFSMVSSGKDTGSYRFEIDSLVQQLRFYHNFFLSRHGVEITALFNQREGYADSNGLFERVINSVQSQLPQLTVKINEEKNPSIYYKGIQAKIMAPSNDGLTEIGDLGFVDWISQMLGVKKERTLISAVSLERQFFPFR